MANRHPIQSSPAALRTVFLDQDGVINRKRPEGQYVTSWEEFELLPGVPAAIRRLNEAGILVLVVSNQRGIALGRCTRAEVDSIHARLEEILAGQGSRIDRIFVCEHDRGACDCRKPAIGLFRQAVAEFPSIQPETSVMIGDSLSDMEFGRRAGMRTIFIGGDPATAHAGTERGRELADANARSLSLAVEIVLRWPARS
jgi:D-glycero-D-manno-heptose 1,7-bisphosphate phosphatase